MNPERPDNDAAAPDEQRAATPHLGTGPEPVPETETLDARRTTAQNEAAAEPGAAAETKADEVAATAAKPQAPSEIEPTAKREAVAEQEAAAESEVTEASTADKGAKAAAKTQAAPESETTAEPPATAQRRPAAERRADTETNAAEAATADESAATPTGTQAASESENTAEPTATAQRQPAAEPGVAAEPEAEPERQAVAEAEVVAEAEPVVGAEAVLDATPYPLVSRRRSPVLVASVAAAVLLVGGGGAYLAASAVGGAGGGTGSGGSGGGGTPPPLALDGYSEGGTAGIAPGEPNPYGVTYRAEGPLPGGPGSAPVYRASGEVTQDEVARLAKALGLDGTPVAKGQAWQVGPSKDGSGPSLVVNRQAPGTWTFHRYAAGTDDCKSMIVCTKDPANPAGDTVSEAAAKKAAAPVLKALGQDDAKVDASQVMGAQRAVNADPVIGGLPTYGWTTGLTVSAEGDVVGGSGQLKTPVKSDTYPVLGAQKTLDLMNAARSTDHRMGIGGCATPVPLKDRLEAPCGQSASAGTATPAKQTVTVDKAVFGLAAHAVDGRQALVPSWLFGVEGAGARNGITMTYPAVDPKYLASDSPTGEPSATGPTSAPATRDVKVDYYLDDGKELTVSFTGGVCADYEATASESSDKVTVKVTETPWKGKVCIMIAKSIQKTVQLREPLGDRKVVGSDGEEILLPNPGQGRPGTPGGATVAR